MKNNKDDICIPEGVFSFLSLNETRYCEVKILSAVREAFPPASVCAMESWEMWVKVYTGEEREKERDEQSETRVVKLEGKLELLIE